MNTQHLRQRIAAFTARCEQLRADQQPAPSPINALLIAEYDREIEQLQHELRQRIQRNALTPREWKDVELTHTAMGIERRQSVTRRWLNRRRHLTDAEIAFLRSANRRTLRFRNQGIEWERPARSIGVTAPA